MFQAALPRLGDPAISREIGMLLGNDLGQMRVQFNARTYVVEPIYRDDGLGLWDFGEDAPPSSDVLELPVDAARIERQNVPDQDDQKMDTTADNSDVGRGRPVASDQHGTIIAKYPEWDRAHGIERPEWTTVREVLAQPGDPRTVEEDGRVHLHSGHGATTGSGHAVGHGAQTKVQHAIDGQVHQRCTAGAHTGRIRSHRIIRAQCRR